MCIGSFETSIQKLWSWAKRVLISGGVIKRGRDYLGTVAHIVKLLIIKI